MVRECRPPAREPGRSWLARRSTMATSTPASANSPASISSAGPPPAITADCSLIDTPVDTPRAILVDQTAPDRALQPIASHLRSEERSYRLSGDLGPCGLLGGSLQRRSEGVEQASQHRQVAVDLLEPDLEDALLPERLGLPGQLPHARLGTPALGLQRERAGIAVRQRMLDRAELVARMVDESADAVDEERQVVGHLKGN